MLAKSQSVPDGHLTQLRLPPCVEVSYSPAKQPQSARLVELEAGANGAMSQQSHQLHEDIQAEQDRLNTEILEHQQEQETRNRLEFSELLASNAELQARNAIL